MVRFDHNTGMTSFSYEPCSCFNCLRGKFRNCLRHEVLMNEIIYKREKPTSRSQLVKTQLTNVSESLLSNERQMQRTPVTQSLLTNESQTQRSTMSENIFDNVSQTQQNDVALSSDNHEQAFDTVNLPDIQVHADPINQVPIEVPQMIDTFGNLLERSETIDTYHENEPFPDIVSLSSHESIASFDYRILPNNDEIEEQANRSDDMPYDLEQSETPYDQSGILNLAISSSVYTDMSKANSADFEPNKVMEWWLVRDIMIKLEEEAKDNMLILNPADIIETYNKTGKLSLPTDDMFKRLPYLKPMDGRGPFKNLKKRFKKVPQVFLNYSLILADRIGLF